MVGGIFRTTQSPIGIISHQENLLPEILPPVIVTLKISHRKFSHQNFSYWKMYTRLFLIGKSPTRNLPTGHFHTKNGTPEIFHPNFSYWKMYTRLFLIGKAPIRNPPTGHFHTKNGTLEFLLPEFLLLKKLERWVFHNSQRKIWWFWGYLKLQKYDF